MLGLDSFVHASGVSYSAMVIGYRDTQIDATVASEDIQQEVLGGFQSMVPSARQYIIRCRYAEHVSSDITASILSSLSRSSGLLCNGGLSSAVAIWSVCNISDIACFADLIQSAGDCVESIAGVFQLFLQWFMFTIM